MVSLIKEVNNMDVESLHVALQQSFSADANLRDPAEELVKNLKYVQGSTTMLIQVAAEKQVQYEVRQAAAIQLKNICKECWAERLSFQGTPIAQTPRPPLLTANDKALVRTGLVETLLAEPEKSIRDILAETLHSIAINDFPQNWPELLPNLIVVIQSNDPLRVHNALLALRKLCKRFEYKSKDQRGPLNDIVNQSFQLLLPLAQRLSLPTEHSLEAALMLKQILKIFWSSTQFYLPVGGPLSSPEAIQPWFDIIQAVVSKPLPEASTGLEPLGQPTDIAERNAWPWWKVKKWAVQIMSRLFSRYGMPGYAEDEVKDFAKHFSVNVAPQFLGPVCETLNLRPSGQFCTDRVVHLCLAYVDLAVELAPTYKMLKPHLDFLLYKVVFPTLCLTTDDIELFTSDPHEFIHRQSSPLADFYDPRMSAITLLTDLVKSRGKDVTTQLLAFLTDCLNRFAATEDDAQKNYIEKDGALLAIGSLSEYLLSKKKYSSQLEGLLVTHVFGDFNSKVGFLRCRACWMLQKFSKVQWTGENLKTVIHLVLQRLGDECLPVQIEASKALRFLIEVETAEDTLLQFLPHLLSEYFRIMTEIGNDEVVAALQVIIDRFGDHIEPHAVALVMQLSNSFSQYCAIGEEDDDAAMAAAQCLECIATVLKGTCGRPELYANMEPNLVPLVLQILGNDGEYIEYLEYALDILTFLTYFPTQIATNLWEALPLIYLAFDQWAFDYLNMMVPPLENFIGKDPDFFLQATTPDGLKYIDLIFTIVAKTVAEERSSESECRKALSLYMTVLHNCKGKIDTYIPLINEIALAKLGQQVSSEIPLTRIAIFQVLGSSLFYNPVLQLTEFEKRAATQQVFQQWMKDSEKMERWLPRKLTVLGLTSILQIPTSAMPPSVQQLLPSLIAHSVKLTLLIKEEEERVFVDDFDDDDEDVVDDEESDDEGFDENEDVSSKADEAYLDALNKLSGGGNEVTQFLAGESWGDDDDYEDDYSSPLDKVDQLYYLEETLKGAFQREPDAYNQIQASLGPETVDLCQKMFQAADKQRVVDQEQAKQLKGG